MPDLDFATYAKTRHQVAMTRRTTEVERHIEALNHINTGGLSAVEQADRLTYALAEEHVWAYLDKFGLSDGMREAGHWLSNSSSHSSVSRRMVQQVKSEVALSTVREIMGYLTDEQVRFFLAGITAKAYGEV